MGEDALDKHLVKKLQEKQRRPATLLLISFLTPTRGFANILRFRPPWYRDGRVVKAASFWSDPPGPEEAAAASGDDPPGEGAVAAGSAPGSVHPAPKPEVLPLWPRYGGVHEFGAWWGFSPVSGSIWGYVKDVKYMPIDVTYSYLWHAGEKWNFRYAPELTALAMLDEPVVPAPKNDPYNLRKRTYGSGVSPVGFRASFFPREPGATVPFDGRRGYLLPGSRPVSAGLAIHVHYRLRRRAADLPQTAPGSHHRLSLPAFVEWEYQPSQSGHGYQRVLRGDVAFQVEGISVRWGTREQGTEGTAEQKRAGAIYPPVSLSFIPTQEGRSRGPLGFFYSLIPVPFFPAFNHAFSCSCSLFSMR